MQTCLCCSQTWTACWTARQRTAPPSGSTPPSDRPHAACLWTCSCIYNTRSLHLLLKSISKHIHLLWGVAASNPCIPHVIFWDPKSFTCVFDYVRCLFLFIRITLSGNSATSCQLY